MIDRLINQSAAGTLVQAASFYARRQHVIADNIVNVSTPGYRQKDLDESSFRSELQRRLDNADRSGAADLSGVAASTPSTTAPGGVMFHDGNNRSIEQLMGDQAKNALRHNLSVELLRKNFAGFHQALRERVA
ncbi:MAG: flagellar basal body protein [Planctomycetota bacterium]